MQGDCNTTNCAYRRGRRRLTRLQVIGPEQQPAILYCTVVHLFVFLKRNTGPGTAETREEGGEGGEKPLLKKGERVQKDACNIGQSKGICMGGTDAWNSVRTGESRSPKWGVLTQARRRFPRPLSPP